LEELTGRDPKYLEVLDTIESIMEAQQIMLRKLAAEENQLKFSLSFSRLACSLGR
jgi:hypothetical protein